MRCYPRPTYQEAENEREILAILEKAEDERRHKEKMAALFDSLPKRWIPMTEQTPPAGLTFVMISSKWKDRQFVVKKSWTAYDTKKNGKKSLSFLYWYPLPPFDQEQESCT